MNKQIFLTTIFVLTLFIIGTDSTAAQNPIINPHDYRADNEARNRAINNRRDDHFSNDRSQTSGRVPTYFTGMSDGEFRKNILSSQAKIESTILKVIDGNTIQITDPKGSQFVRILGVDAPELAQPGGAEAKAELEKLVSGKKVTLRFSGFYNREPDGVCLGEIFLEEKNVGLSLVENGFAWYDDEYKFFFSKEAAAENEQAQKQARAAKVGIWREAKPQSPWEYREKKIKETEKAKKKSGKS